MATLPQRFLSMMSMPGANGSSERIAVPGRDRGEGLQFLRSVAAGSTLGTGITFQTDLEALRLNYETQVEAMNIEVGRMKSEGKSLDEIARWAVGERLRIARSIRWRQGPGTMITLELRDNFKYGLGGKNLRQYGYPCAE